jgi:hypothetical protein
MRLFLEVSIMKTKTTSAGEMIGGIAVILGHMLVVYILLTGGL